MIVVTKASNQNPPSRWWRAACLAALLLLSSSSRAVSEDPIHFRLEEALKLAHESNFVLQAARYRIAESEGDVVTAAVRLVDNPDLNLGSGPRSPRSGSGASSTDFSLGIEQRFELRGQRRLRMEQADRRLKASQYEAEDVQRVSELAVTMTFFEALARTAEVALREEGESLASGLFDLAQRRLDLGEGTPLEVNTARLRRAAARRQVLEARAAQQLATYRLAQLLGINPARELRLEGELPKGDVAQTEDLLVSNALELRPDIRATEERAEAARAAASLIEAQRWAGIRAGLSLEREENDEIVLGTISVPLPFANRNRGERLRAQATIERTLVESQATQLAAETEVRTAFAEYERAKQSLALYDADVLTAQQESLGLLERALEAGEVGYAEVLVVQREVLDARAEHLETRLAFAQARAALLAAAHLPQIDPTGATP